ncbi:hypothetical protein WMY93_027690 [Mugilogobius chulae]|uniref:ZP domain-containing protein n=1 Tax=Mugilogobius chulae TaxID=88201 RepID=A0AAW0MZG7_9GOBI
MLLLLLYLALVTHLTGAATEDISSCSVAYFGKVSTSLEVKSDSSGTSSVCFLESGTSDAGGDCMKFNLNVPTVRVEVDPQSASPRSCKIHLTFTVNNQDALVLTIIPSGTVGSLGKETTLSVGVKTQTTVELYVEDKLMKTVNYESSGAGEDVDLTGCRHKGNFVEKLQKACSDKTVLVTCGTNGEINEEQCGRAQVCFRDSTTPAKCVLHAQCSVVGPAMMDFKGQHALAPDFCSYTLLEAGVLKVVAQFKERRRTDMPFLHRIIITLKESDTKTNTIIIGPGRQVKVNTSPLTFSEGNLQQTIDSVILAYSDNICVATIISKENGKPNWIIVMDGTSVLITGDGDSPLPDEVTGSCIDISQGAIKNQEHSPNGCDTVPTEPVDSSIDCPTRTQRCATILSEESIQSCSHPNYLHQQFSEACKETLCKYPEQDELYCQFLSSFAKMCGVQEAVNYLEKAYCSLNECPDTVCRDSEFCEHVGVPRCKCRAGVYKDFKQGETTCQNQQASVSIPLCVLTEKGLDVKDLHLNQKSCKGTVDATKEQITFSFDSSAQCDTKQEEQNDKIVFKNTVQFDAKTDSELISRKSSYKLDFSCFYSQPDDQNIHFKTKGADGLMAAIKGSWPYKINVGMFSDLNLKNPIDFSKGLTKNQMIYISLETDGMDGALLLMKADDCYATDSETGGSKYSLISGGCGNPKDKSIKVFPAKGNRGTVMRIKMFQFKGGKKNVFLKCKMKLCLSTTPGCKPDCDSKTPGNSGNTASLIKLANSAAQWILWRETRMILGLYFMCLIDNRGIEETRGESSEESEERGLRLSPDDEVT